MILDNETQRAMLMEIITKVQYPGTAIDAVYDLKKAIEQATIQHANQKEHQQKPMALPEA